MFVNAASKFLDVGCGTGYGSALLAEKAGRVVGVDNAWDAVQYARANYLQQNLSFACADCRSLPFQDNFFDRAIVFEVIEHVSEQTRCLAEIRRVLGPKGMLILSTPNPAGPTKAIDGPNPFHQRELQEHELLELLRPHFGHVQLLYQHEVNASRIESASLLENGRSAEIVENFAHDSAPKYFLAVCSHERVRLPAKSLLGVGGIEHQVAIVLDLRQKEKDLIALRREIDALFEWREDHVRESTRNLAAHQQVIARLREEMAALNARLDEEMTSSNALRDTIAGLHKEISVRDLRIAALENEYAGRRMELEWLYRWLPVNRLAYRLLYGRNLRRRILRKLGAKT
jgi:SAM-dependent methyltransferase